ncbi:MAG: TraM recognition domain-containing protein [Clostridia bacterium]|nr:TraM recognition domain-containing protein [Clostridia bacterium]
MKLIDKFLKKLNTSRNTFATYILTLISIYLAVDRITEMLIMIFSGVSISYWGPFKYTIAMACVVFAYLFSIQSEFGKSKNVKITLFYVYVIGLYVMAISMITQWVNELAWLLFLSVPNYTGIISEFSDLVKPAFTALALYFPLVTVLPIIKKIVLGVNDSTEMKRSLWDFKGINLTESKEGKGPYSYEMFMFSDKETGKPVKMLESKRFQPTLVCGASGTGKTSLIFEPMMARDIEKKFFFREVSKEMGFTALKTGIATLRSPYNNEYINENFSLNMLVPKEEKEKVFKAYMKKLIVSDSDSLIYKNIGITCMAPDFEVISHMMDVCENFKIKYNLIDPSSNSSMGLNPFIYKDPSKIATTVSSVLKGMYLSKNAEKEDAYSEDVTLQAVENLTILLKEIYPRMNEGALPNLEDMLKLLINFELVEKMCKILEADNKLAEKYAIQLAYFKRNFFKDGVARQDTERAISTSVSQLDNLLRIPGVKSVLCNRHENINFDDMLANGDVTFVCTRRGELGATAHKAFGLFFLLSMQNSVLSRPGFESTRIPNILYIDEFADFVGKSTESLFTMYRKYRVGVVVSAQSLAQFGEEHSRFRENILANCRSKIFTGGTTPDEAEWWMHEFNRRRKWSYSKDLDVKNGKIEYNSKYGGVKYDWEDYFKPGRLLGLGFKQCAYEIASDKKPFYGEGVLNFMDSKYKEPQSIKRYDFDRFSDKDNGRDDTYISGKKVVNDDSDSPVKTDTSDSKYFYDNQDAVSYKLPRRGKK